jgi:hypothetical protein
LYVETLRTERKQIVKSTRLLVVLVASMMAVAGVRGQQNPSPSPSPAQPTAEQKAAREKQLTERRAEMKKRAVEREASAAKRASERQATAAKRDQERKIRVAEQNAKRQAMAAKRTAERQANNAKRAAERETRVKRSEERRTSHETFRFLSSKMNADFARVVRGAPYSAVAVTEFLQQFVDGNQIVRRNEAAYYRDSEGRVRVEQKLNTIGKWSADGDAPRIIMIGDPVSGEYYDLDPRTRTAMKNVGLGRRLQEQKLRQQRDEAGTKQVEPKSTDSLTKVSADGRRRTESLGSQRIEGVEAQGTRTVTTIPAGEIGNTLPIEITEERWYSPELQALVMTKRHDPRSGDTTYRLTNIRRHDPERSLFQVPADYTIVDRSAPKPPNLPKPPKPPNPAPKPVPQQTKTETEKRSKSQVFD